MSRCSPPTSCSSGGSEVTVQSAQQVQTARGTGSSAQQGYVTASTLLQEQPATGGPTGPSTSRAQFHAALYGDSVQTGTTQTTFPSVQAAPTLGQQQAHAPAQRVQSPPSGTLVVLWTAPGALSCHLRPMVLEEAVVARMEGVPLLHSLPSMLAPRTSRDRVRPSPCR